MDSEGRFKTPPDITTRMLLEKKKIGGKGATAEQLCGIEGIHRLLLQDEAARAVALLRPAGTPTTATGAAQGMIISALTTILPVLKLRSRGPGVLLAALFRWVV